ncbi:uncharacterized protein BX663DRAFT_492290 [Cokeromyces recurvatus]|uniref:uncharacterized protein n=1 Tax=Cokeromyces recurvatus TaxID=90255 RepID=UPI00221FEEE8|nr:uncharacterized protein BX663DRAFT_492290 [Cokeromyces recurvatus]KAI7907873.1 hypothetical protein BX663DRAFT_492290 [Cokeromyces recurvatus]
MEDEIVQKIYRLASELVYQQQNNQDLASGLSSQLSELKNKASTKYNLDVQDIYIPNPLLPEQRDEIIENLKSQLDIAIAEKKATTLLNQQLQAEVKDLQSIIREYEEGFEMMTSKLRVHANTRTEGQIRLKREYEALLDAEKSTTAALFMENIMLQTQLRKLSNCLRKVFEHESSEDSHEQEIVQLKKENQALLELLKVSKLSEQEPMIEEKSSPVLKVIRTAGVVEEFFNDE